MYSIRQNVNNFKYIIIECPNIFQIEYLLLPICIF